MSKKSLFSAILFAFTTLTLHGCGGSDEPENIDVEGCEHLSEGPPAAITASDTAVPAAAAVAIDHKRYDVTLATSGSMKGGYVRFASAAAGSYVFFLGTNIPFAIEDGAAAAVTLTSSATSSTQCTDIKGRYTASLGVGTYFLKLGPTAETAVSIVAEENPTP